jgi:hypothetical protein
MARRSVAIALGVYVVGLAAFAAFVAVPFLDKKRDIPAEVPSPPGLIATDIVVIHPKQRVCMTDVAISPQARQMRFQVGTFGRRGPAVVTAVRAAGGYMTSHDVPGGYADNSTITVPVPAPARSTLATVCVRNRGTRRVALYAASDVARSRVKVFVDGKPRYPTPVLSFHEARTVSLADRAGVTAGRIAVFRGFLDHAWIVWLLAVVAVVGVPLLVGVGLATSEGQRRSDSSAG